MVEIGLIPIEVNKGKEVVLEQEGECIVCTSHTPNKDGYIRLYQRAAAGKQRYKFLHRMVWETNKGSIPSGYEVDHVCRNRRCCNPNHLQLLTHSEHKSKTNRERYKDRIDGIEFALEEGYPVKTIAAGFGVSVATVNRIKRINKEK